ncbi:MAG: hypothetical protein F6J87_03875 [Spirulina sp. SIO3F2]|nr:hypothetical protein [Spirulina sp. SIO3F2]
MSILETIKSREVLGLSGRFNMLFSNAAFQAARIVPARYRWIVTSTVQTISLPTPEFTEVKEEVIRILTEGEATTAEPEVEILTPPPPLYTAYKCLHNNPLQCEWPGRTLEENPDAKTCIRCGFPALLPPETRVQGKRGRYQIDEFLKTRNLGRLYRGIDLLDRQPVIIKEYLLPVRHFRGNEDELRRRQSNFDYFTNLELADRRTPDMRWDIPIDGIVELIQDEDKRKFQAGRAYAILPETPEGFPTLGQYIKETGPLSAFLVRQILLQVLQSLEGLHEQRYRLPTGIVQEGVMHGNLSLDSLLIVPNFQGFYIYLADPALWEHLFLPPNQTVPEPSVAEDLKALGNVAFYLLAGRSADPGTLTPLDPGVPEYWPAETPEFLRRYILSLVGLNDLPFESASLARQALLKFPIPEPVVVTDEPDAEAEEKKAQGLLPRWVWILVAILLGASVLALIVWFFGRRSANQTALEPPTVCCVDQVTGLPLQTVTFTGEAQGVWTSTWLQANLIAKDKTLAGEIDRRLNPDSEPVDNAAIAPPKDVEAPPQQEAAPTDAATAAGDEAADAVEEEVVERITLNYLPLPSATEAFTAIRNQNAEFAVSSLLENLGIDLWYRQFAFDAIVVYVAFSYEARQNGLPEALNGQISLRQLRRLYTGEVSNWQEIGGPDMPVKLYMPTDEEAVAIFEQRVLQSEQAIAQFRELSTRRTSASAASTQVTRLTTFQTLNAVLRDFETQQVGAIAFGSLSQVFGQCSVYPLALSKGLSGAVSPLIDSRGFPISPATDLCNEKGSYTTNIAAMRQERYPLSYPLAVVYPRDNRRQPIGEAFAALLNTDESQLLLKKAGLIPLREINELELERKLGGEEE